MDSGRGGDSKSFAQIVVIVPKILKSGKALICGNVNSQAQFSSR